MTLMVVRQVIKEFIMSHPDSNTTKKYISMPTLLSTFIGVMAAVPMALGMYGSLNAGAAQPATQAGIQATGDDFAKYAHAFSQGYEANTVSTTSTKGDPRPSSCSEGSMTSAEHGAAHATTTAPGTSHARTHAAPIKAHSRASAKHMPTTMKSDRAARMIESYNNYVSTINNHSTVSTVDNSTTSTSTNVNSGNTVGSHNSTKTNVKVDDSKGVVIGVSNDTSATQNNASESFNEDSYNTKTETSIVNDSFNTDFTNTTDIDVTEQTAINNTVTNVEDSNNTHNHTNNVNNNSNNTAVVDTDVDINSHNDTAIIAPVVVDPAPVAVVEPLPVGDEV